MKRFIKKILLFTLLFVTINLVLLFSIPKDCNAYLCEYNHKVELIDKTPQPRMMFIGGSNIAFGINSKTIIDSLHINVINLGLHGGIGIRFPLEDYLQYVKKGDIVVIQMEYENYKGGNGELETFLPLMVATDWRKTYLLNLQQWENIVLGVPQVAIGNLKRLIKYPFTGSFDTSTESVDYGYSKSGFNEFGDEVSHLNYPSKYPSIKKDKEQEISIDFLEWLTGAIQRYEEVGAKVVMLPPVIIASHFKAHYNDNIEKALEKFHHPYIVKPEYMSLHDSCVFNTRYHVNAEGVKQNTAHIISVFKNNPQIFVSDNKNSID